MNRLQNVRSPNDSWLMDSFDSVRCIASGGGIITSGKRYLAVLIGSRI